MFNKMFVCVLWKVKFIIINVDQRTLVTKCSVGARLCAIDVGHSDKWSVVLRLDMRGSTHHLIYSLTNSITLLDFVYLLNTKGCTVVSLR